MGDWEAGKEGPDKILHHTLASSQHYGPSVITSLDEQDALGHFFQYRGTPFPLPGPAHPHVGELSPQRHAGTPSWPCQ